MEDLLTKTADELRLESRKAYLLEEANRRKHLFTRINDAIRISVEDGRTVSYIFAHYATIDKDIIADFKERGVEIYPQDYGWVIDWSGNERKIPSTLWEKICRFFMRTGK